jgi:SAM-dependent methyltransferase
MADAKTTVTRGYDAIAGSYLAYYGSSLVRERWLNRLLELLPPRPQVLDLGCGAGLPVAKKLSDHGCAVVGIDLSARQIVLAQTAVPKAEFIQADMTKLALLPASFDAVTAFYSITHVPREEHEDLLRQIAIWLKPGGVFLASLGTDDLPCRTESWLRVQMFFSHYDATRNAQLVEAAGLKIQQMEIVGQDNEDARFLWVIACAPDA